MYFVFLKLKFLIWKHLLPHLEKTYLHVNPVNLNPQQAGKTFWRLPSPVGDISSCDRGFLSNIKGDAPKIALCVIKAPQRRLAQSWKPHSSVWGGRERSLGFLLRGIKHHGLNISFWSCFIFYVKKVRLASVHLFKDSSKFRVEKLPDSRAWLKSGSSESGHK